MADDPLSRVFAALADPTRREILSRLGSGPATVGELAEPFRMSRPAISQHLKVLQNAGLVEQQATAQWRTCRVRPQGLDEAESWVSEHRAAWSAAFDRLDDALADIVADVASTGKSPTRKSRRPTAPGRAPDPTKTPPTKKK